MSSADVGDWYTMYEGVQVQASHRQSSDAEWYVTPSDWKLQLWIKQNAHSPHRQPFNNDSVSVIGIDSELAADTENQKGVDGQVTLIELSRNFGQPAAILAGLGQSRGHCVVIMCVR